MTVCEIAIKKTLKAPKSFELVSVSVIGSSVMISYDAVNEYNAPLRHSQTCEFYRSEGGKTSLVPLEIPALIRQGVSLRERTKTVKTVEEATKLEKDAQAAQMAMTATMLRIATIGREASKVTEYPIPEGATKVVPLSEFPRIPD